MPEWEDEAKRRFGGSSDFLRRVAPIPWLRRSCAAWTLYPITVLPVRLADLMFLVVSQENSCRYCYGAARAHMRILGYSDRVISQIERETQLAELDAKDQAFIRFCRNLARSNPRPAHARAREMIQLGFSPAAITEAAFLIVNHCFHEPVATFLACPPVVVYERLGRSLLGRLLRPMLATANRRSIPVPADFKLPEGAPFAEITNTLSGLPAAYLLHEALTGAFDSPVLSRRIKALMFGVVARMLECRFCRPAEPQGAAAPKDSRRRRRSDPCGARPRPSSIPSEAAILSWVRETVRYSPGQVQKRTRALGEVIGMEAMLEAVGVAALANATVRLGMLLE